MQAHRENAFPVVHPDWLMVVREGKVQISMLTNQAVSSQSQASGPRHTISKRDGISLVF